MKAAVIFLVLICGPASGQTIWYVDVSATGPGTGTQSDPFTSIQVGINAAATADTVLVSPGTYVENLTVIGKYLDIVSTGGAAVTIIDGSQAGSVVTFYNSLSSGGRLEGFTITNGRGVSGASAPALSSSTPYCAALPGSDGAAGGINCAASSPLVKDCVITGNTGGAGGGGGTCSHPTFNGQPAISPSRGGRGGPGGALLINSSARFENCSFLSNTGGNGGTGATGWSGGPFSVAFTTGALGGVGGPGAIRHAQAAGGPPAVVGCVVAGNQGGAGGNSGWSCVPNWPNLTCGGSQGARGGIGGAELVSGAIASSTVSANVGGGGGSGTGPGGTPVGAVGAGGVDGNVSVVNSIVWGNLPGDLGTNPSVSYSNVNGATGVGVTTVPPGFVDPANGDYHLLPTSQCIDAGDNTDPNLPMFDIDGDSRVFHGTVDMGADETILTQVMTQAAPGQPVTLTNYNLTAGNEYYNVFSIQLCAGGSGAGPSIFGGLCATTPASVAFLTNQLTMPVGVAPFHFVSNADTMTFGPYNVTPITLDGICFDFTGGVFGDVSRVTRFVVQ